MSRDKLRVVTPSAERKDRFIIVDAVGVCEQDKTETCTLNRKPSATLPELLEYVNQGGIDADALETLAGRLARLQREFTPEQLTELRQLSDGKSIADISHDLLNACDADTQLNFARNLAGPGVAPTEQHMQAAALQLAQQAVTPLMKPALRRRILEIRAQNEQTMDRHNLDEVLYSGFDTTAVEKAQTKVQDFRRWIGEHRDELTALQVLYSGVRPLRVSLGDLRQLRDALARPPISASPTQTWSAFQAVEGEAVKGRGETQLPDLVNLGASCAHFRLYARSVP